MNRKPVGVTAPYRKAGVVIDKSAAKRIATSLGWEPKREWVGLTQAEVVDALCEHSKLTGNVGLQHLIYITEAKLKEKNT